MRVELWNDWVANADGEGYEVWVFVDGQRLARAEYVDDFGYYVDRDYVSPDLERAVRDLEDGPGSKGPLAEGEIRGIDVPAPTHLEMRRARMNPSYRPRPETNNV